MSSIYSRYSHYSDRKHCLPCAAREGGGRRDSAGERGGEKEDDPEGKEMEISQGSIRTLKFPLCYCTIEFFTCLSQSRGLTTLRSKWHHPILWTGKFWYGKCHQTRPKKDWLTWPQSPGAAAATLLPFQLEEPECFLIGKSHRDCLVIKIQMKCERNCLDAGCISMNYWTPEPSHKS